MTQLQVPINAKDHIQGSDDAIITLVEYGDYQCEDCAKAYEVIKLLQNHFKERLRFVFRNFPLTQIHPYAEIAAETCELASEYEQFWEMHDLIYENQEKLSREMLIELGKLLNLPVEKLRSALEKKSYQPQIHEEFLGGVRSGVKSTPTFFINNERYTGHNSFDSLLLAINRYLL